MTAAIAALTQNDCSSYRQDHEVTLMLEQHQFNILCPPVKNKKIEMLKIITVIVRKLQQDCFTVLHPNELNVDPDQTAPFRCIYLL